MAVKDCDKVSNIIAVAIAAGDDDISNVVASLSKIKNDALQRSRALRESWEAVDTLTWYTPHELELRASSADIKIRAIVQASILKWDKGNEAFTELARQIKKTKGSIAWGVNLLEMVHNAPMADYQEIARLWDNTMDVSEAMKDLNDWLSEFISSNYSIRAYSDFYEWEVASAKKALKDKKIDEKEYEKRIKNAHKEAMNKIAKGENPSGFVPLDNEWQAIKKVYWDDPKMAWRAWSQYIMAREFLADWGLDEDLLKAFEFWWEELLWDLTPEWIAKCTDLDQLLARAFTNTEQLYRDGALRAVYRDKLSELASWEILTEKNAKKMRTLVKVSLFAEEWATLSDVLLDNRAYTSMKDMGYKVTERQWSQIYNDLRSFARAYNASIEKWEVNFWDTATKIAGQEVQPKDILQLIYDITWDKNILALVEAWNFSDWAILNMATQKLLWDNEKAKTALIKLFKKGKEWNKITNSRWVFLRAITWLEVPDWANIAFFDYRKGLYYKDELSSAKADFMDKLAEKNKMKVMSEWIQDLTMQADATDENVQLLVQQLKDKNIAWGFIIVNDSAYKDNPLLRKALDQFTDDKSITVLYPRGWLWANFSMENWSIFYKTIYDDTYDNVAWRISIQSMWEAKPTREMLASAYEAQTWRNGDKLRYQASYNDWGVDSLGRQISDQQVEYFARSAARDEDGNLMVFYHWTNAKFDTFDINAARRQSDIQWMFFSEREDDARWYWQNVWEYYLNITNPAPASVAYDKVFKKYKWQTNAWVLAREELQRMGYDWVQSYQWEWIVFDSNQIKAVDNRVPTTDPNMHFQTWYHWWWAKFEKFNLEYSWTWEWWAAHWYGVYIARNKDTAWRYADGVSADRVAKWKWIDENDLADEVLEYKWNAWGLENQEKSQASSLLNDMSYLGISFEEAYNNQLKYLEDRLERRTAMWSDEASINWIKNSIKALKRLKKEDFFVGEPTRHFYTVNFPDPKKVSTPTWGNYLNEHLPLSKQEIKEFQEYFAKNWERYMDGEWNSSIYWDIPFIRWLNEYVDWRELYIALEDTLWSDEAASRFLKDMWYDWIHYWWKQDWECWVVFDANKINILDRQSYMRRLWQYTDQPDMPITDALKVQMFTKDRTAADIANWYWFPIEYIHNTDLIQWVKAYWAYWNGVIYFTDIVKESTPPHELFHWIFNMYVKGQDPDMYERVLRESSELFWVSEYKAEEILADSFAEWFRTWEFTYWEKLKKEAEEVLSKEWKIKKKGLNKKQESLVAQILEYFKEIAKQLWILDNHRAEVKQMFDDMVNMKYLPDAWKPVSAADAMVRYNDELNKAAVKYFWQVLWESSEVVDSEYIRRVETLLSDMLWMDIKTFNTFKDNSELWRRIDKELTLERLTTWRFDKEIVDIKKVRDDIANMSDEELAKDINEKFWVLVRWWTIEWNENISLIREAWFDYNTAKDTTDLLSAKWKIISLVNWVNAQTVSIDDIKTMFQNKTFADKYKELFFPEQALNDKDMELFIRQINSDLFDWLSIQFAENLVKAGYSLPLVNVKRVVYDYLNNSLDLNSDFVQAFFYKNNIPYTKDNLDTIMTTLMPKEFSFDFDALKWRLYDDSLVWNVSTVVESQNRFLPDSYSALYAIEDSWKWITLWNKEYDVLVWMVDKYIDTVLKWMSEWKLKFWDAQTLKAELSYAMDTFEQDFIMPKYWAFLTPQDKQIILGMKYTIPIWVTWQPINEVEKMLNAWRIRLLWDWKTTKWEFRRVLWTMVDNADINAAIAKGYNKAVTPKELQERIERRRNQLITNWSTIKEINWEYVVYDSKDALWETINSLPDNIEWLAWLKAMTRDEIEDMTNKQAYILLRYLEAAKSLSATADYATQLMYKQSPQLAQYSFFSTYVVDPETWLPRIMRNNSLNVDEFFNNIAGSVTADDAIKKDIFTDIVNKFRKDGYVLAHSKKDADGKIIERWLDDMISSAVDRQVDELQSIKLTPENTVEAKNKMQNIYTNMFIPYTYLKDIPDWGYIRMLGSAQNVVPLEDVKKKVETTMKEAYTKAIEDLKAAWATDADKIQQVITIRLNDWERLTLADLANQNIDSWKKQIFNDQSIFVRGADEDWEFVVDETETLAKQQEIKKEEKEYRERIQNSYLSSLQTILNEWQSVSDAERELMTSFMLDVRTDLRKYDLTSKLVDALDALSWINEEVARWIKNYLIWFGWTITFGKYKPGDILERYKLVRDAYKGYYDMSLEQLMKAAPKNHAEEVARNAARYFKNLERLLGSVDWVQWVTTSKEANKAFYHLWEVFMNLNTNPQSTEWVRWIFSMLSAIEQNQPLKFFKFSESWQASYYKPFKQNPAWKDRWLDGLWGYRDYVETINNITREDFNKLFGANYSDEQFKRVLQWLSWFSLTWGWLWRKVNKIMDIMNGSWLAFRFAMSYPWQLLTIPLQGTAYFLKQLWHELRLGIESLSAVDNIREQFWIWDWAYNELVNWQKLSFNPDSKDVNSFYNRYWIPDIKEFYKDTWITAADDYVNMYAKLDAKYSKPDKIMNAIRWFDPYKDNANNFVDWMFARNFKNIAFVKWLKDNDFMKFSTAEDFLDFMNDATISSEVKSKLLDSVAASTGRNFRNILWLGFGWIDRAIWAKQWQNILFWLMQMFNFRWSWWQNIVKQTGANITHLLQWMVWWTRLSKTSRDEVAKFIANSPEYVNFMTSLMTDLEWAYKLTRYQDNGRWPDEDKDGIYYFLDYLSFMWENMNMVSQWWQWLQSFGPLRPLQEQWQSALRSQMDPTVYQDTYWLWALFNAIWKNFLRQRKPINWLTELIWAFESWGPKNARAFITNRFFNLSFWSLRYMVNEDENAYGYTYEVTWQYGWIPSIVMWEAQMGSDKSFTYELDNNETWKNLELFFFEDIPWSQKKVYWGNLWSALVNGSQFASALKNSIKVATGKYSKSFFTSEDLAWTLKKTPAGRELYEKWYVTPRTNAEASTFMKTILNNSEYRPGSSSFNKSLINFEDFWHMAWEKWKEADSGMELRLEHMKYQTDWHWEFIKENWQRVIDPGRTALITNVKTYYWNTDYVTNVIYNYAKDWLDIHNSDPNYPMYMKMLWQWQAHMLLENEVKKRVKEKNIWLSKDWKWNQTKFDQAEYRDMLLEIGNTVLEWDNMIFFDKLNRLDIDDATLAAIRIIEKQSTEEDRKEIEKFFVPKTDDKDDDIVEELELKPQYQGVLKQIANIGRAMDEGNVERVIATASSLANLYKDDDPTWIITASVVNSVFNRIYQAPNLTPEQKQEMMIWVFYDNKDFIQRNPEKMRELLWDNYDAYADLMNEMIYKRDWQVISNLESLQSSWTGSKASTAKGRKLSNNLKSISLSNWSKWGWTTKTGRKAWHGYWERVPVVIKWADLVKQLWLKGYSPLNVKESVFKYTPHADFSLRKDINRNVKGPTTETISTKKQLSNIESKTTKALEAES